MTLGENSSSTIRITNGSSEEASPAPQAKRRMEKMNKLRTFFTGTF
jgi:hypothetical protein